MKKQPKITDSTREAFVTAFFNLAKTKGLKEITIKEITNLAGYNRTTFYRYFDDISDLLEYTEDKLIDGIFSDILPQATRPAAFDDKFFQLFFKHFNNFREQLKIIISDSNRTMFIQRLQYRLQDFLDSTMHTSKYSQIIMDIYFNGIFSAIYNHLQHPERISDEKLLSIIRELFEKWYWPALSSNHPSKIF